MAIYIIYIFVFLIFLFVSYLLIKSVMRGIGGINKNKKVVIEKLIIKQY